MASPIRVLVLFGGRSSEHEVSCLSARNVLSALDPARYLITTVGITREGRWTLVDGVPDAQGAALPSVSDEGDTVALVQTRKGPRLVRFPTDQASDGGEHGAVHGEELGPVDVCFPVLHGPYGEDGTVQGLLASLGIPYVGADVASSAVGIDKRQMKNVFKARGLPQVPHLTVRRHVWEADRGPVLDDLEAALGYPLFTKPARQGSSIGIRRCTTRAELVAGIEEAFAYDRVAVVEEGLDDVREIECGVLGNSRLQVTRPGETVHTGEFYDFDAKYIAPVELRCPAEVPEDVSRACMEHARQAYLAIGCRGMARVDFFYVEATGALFVNEINTIPGFTAASMFPAVWAAEGRSYPQLVDDLLALALRAARAEARYAP
jgi:D-alanine-D-alanine ligase